MENLYPLISIPPKDRTVEQVNNIMEILHHNDFIQNLINEGQTELVRLCCKQIKLQTFKQNQNVLEPSKQIQGLYILLQGDIGILEFDHKIKKKLIVEQFNQPGYILGNVNEQQKFPEYTYICLTPCNFAFLPLKDFKKLNTKDEKQENLRLIEFLEQIQKFKQLNKVQLKNFIKQLKILKVSKQEKIFIEGNYDSNVYIVRKGIFIALKNKKQSIINHNLLQESIIQKKITDLVTYDIFGQEDIISDNYKDYSVQNITNDSELIVIEKHFFKNFVMQNDISNSIFTSKVYSILHQYQSNNLSKQNYYQKSNNYYQKQKQFVNLLKKERSKSVNSTITNSQGFNSPQKPLNNYQSQNYSNNNRRYSNYNNYNNNLTYNQRPKSLNMQYPNHLTSISNKNQILNQRNSISDNSTKSNTYNFKNQLLENPYQSHISQTIDIDQLNTKKNISQQIQNPNYNFNINSNTLDIENSYLTPYQQTQNYQNQDWKQSAIDNYKQYLQQQPIMNESQQNFNNEDQELTNFNMFEQSLKQNKLNNIPKQYKDHRKLLLTKNKYQNNRKKQQQEQQLQNKSEIPDLKQIYQEKQEQLLKIKENELKILQELNLEEKLQNQKKQNNKLLNDQILKHKYSSNIYNFKQNNIFDWQNDIDEQLFFDQKQYHQFQNKQKEFQYLFRFYHYYNTFNLENALSNLLEIRILNQEFKPWFVKLSIGHIQFLQKQHDIALNTLLELYHEIQKSPKYFSVPNKDLELLFNNISQCYKYKGNKQMQQQFKEKLKIREQQLLKEQQKVKLSNIIHNQSQIYQQQQQQQINNKQEYDIPIQYQNNNNQHNFQNIQNCDQSNEFIEKNDQNLISNNQQNQSHQNSQYSQQSKQSQQSQQQSKQNKQSQQSQQPQQQSQQSNLQSKNQNKKQIQSPLKKENSIIKNSVKTEQSQQSLQSNSKTQQSQSVKPNNQKQNIINKNNNNQSKLAPNQITNTNQNQNQQQQKQQNNKNLQQSPTKEQKPENKQLKTQESDSKSNKIEQKIKTQESEKKQNKPTQKQKTQEQEKQNQQKNINTQESEKEKIKENKNTNTNTNNTQQESQQKNTKEKNTKNNTKEKDKNNQNKEETVLNTQNSEKSKKSQNQKNTKTENKQNNNNQKETQNENGQLIINNQELKDKQNTKQQNKEQIKDNNKKNEQNQNNKNDQNKNQNKQDNNNNKNNTIKDKKETQSNKDIDNKNSLNKDSKQQNNDKNKKVNKENEKKDSKYSNKENDKKDLKQQNNKEKDKQDTKQNKDNDKKETKQNDKDNQLQTKKEIKFQLPDLPFDEINIYGWMDFLPEDYDDWEENDCQKLEKDKDQQIFAWLKLFFFEYDDSKYKSALKYLDKIQEKNKKFKDIAITFFKADTQLRLNQYEIGLELILKCQQMYNDYLKTRPKNEEDWLMEKDDEIQVNDMVNDYLWRIYMKLSQPEKASKYFKLLKNPTKDQKSQFQFQQNLYEQSNTNSQKQPQQQQKEKEKSQQQDKQQKPQQQQDKQQKPQQQQKEKEKEKQQPSINKNDNKEYEMYELREKYFSEENILGWKDVVGADISEMDEDQCFKLPENKVVEANIRLFTIDYDEESFDTAIEYCKKLLQNNSNYKRLDLIYYLIGEAYLMEDDYENALKYSEKAYQFLLTNKIIQENAFKVQIYEELYINLCILYQLKKDFKKSNYFRQIVEQNKPKKSINL